MYISLWSWNTLFLVLRDKFCLGRRTDYFDLLCKDALIGKRKKKRYYQFSYPHFSLFTFLCLPSLGAHRRRRLCGISSLCHYRPRASSSRRGYCLDWSPLSHPSTLSTNQSVSLPSPPPDDIQIIHWFAIVTMRGDFWKSSRKIEGKKVICRLFTHEYMRSTETISVRILCN